MRQIRLHFPRPLKPVLAVIAVVACSGIAAETGAPDTESRPNVLLILADDMGFSDAGCYGGDIRTPNLDTLANGGLRFTQFYSTARCWPSRACILTGYYAQQVRRDSMPGIKMDKRPAWAPLLPDLLAPLGYHSYHSGKWHIDGEPKHNGFERSWGAGGNGCDEDRFHKSGIWQEDGARAPVKPGEAYYSTTAIADHAIQCLKLHGQLHAGAPFFQYVAFYSPHFPLQALEKDIAAYSETYLEGWDVMRKRRWERMTKMGIVNCPLSARDERIIPSWNMKQDALRNRIGDGEVSFATAWETLSDTQKRFQAGKMAVHAAMVSRMDEEIGRIIAQLKDMGAYENTLILFASDNGASAEQMIRGDGHDKSAPPGSARTFLCLGPGWSTVANAPFRLHKHWNHEGGISSPLIVHWPKGIRAKGELRKDPSHFIDIAPTILELAGGKWPAEYKGQVVPKHPGVSLTRAFAADGAVRHEAIWWCHQGNRAVRAGDWKLSLRSANDNKWELYDMKVDRCEMNDLSARHPEKVADLAAVWKKIGDGFIRDLGKPDSREE